MVTKSGTEQFHGSGYWYHRNDGLNANTFLNNVRGLPSAVVPIQRSRLHHRRAGLTFRTMEKLRHKVFFFFSQEWQRQLSPGTVEECLVPTALERKGDFSQSIEQQRRSVGEYHRPHHAAAVPRNVHSGEPNLRARPGAAEYLPAAQRDSGYRTTTTRRRLPARRPAARHCSAATIT